MQAFDDVLDSGKLCNPLTDAQLLANYKQLDELIYLSLGETWIPPAQGLIDALANIPTYAHGYTLSPYGLPTLRRTLQAYIKRTHQLPDSPLYDVAVSQAGTRAAMADFGQLVMAHYGKPCTAIVPNPGWDYEGVFAPLGFAIRSYELTAEQNWQPNPAQIEQLITDNSLLVINAQHNPTATNWSPAIVTQLIDIALKRNAAILIDDAYYALYSPDDKPTSALRIMVEQLTETSTSPWLAVRTMGKQFRSNGWGIGALTAHPETLSKLVAIAHQHSYGPAQPLQAAMAAWLNDPAADQYLTEIRQHYANARQRVSELLIDLLGFPKEAVYSGSCTSYLRYLVPSRFIKDNDEEAYRKLCLQAGVLPGRGTMTNFPKQDQQPCIRIHLGHSIETLEQAFERLHHANLGWKE